MPEPEVEEMHEEAKLQEARYFYELMQKSEDDYEAFRHNLSALLSAARSVLQYALEEVDPELPNGNRAGGPRRGWYDEQIRTHTTLSFFGSKRNVNIHWEPLHPSQDVTVPLTGVSGSASVGALMLDAQGDVTKIIALEESKPAQPPSDPPTAATYRYWFDDWSGPEDLMVLCKLHLDELEAVVADGQGKGLLTAP